MADKNNILFVILDTVRSRNLSLNGYQRETTPKLAEIAAESVEYTEARATAPWTLPSHSSMFTGLYPTEHGTTSETLGFNLPDRHLASQLSNAGYTTGLFTSNTYLSTPTFGLASKFDYVYSDQADVLFPEGINPDAFTKVHGKGSHWEFLRSSLSHDHTIKSLLNGLSQKAEDFSHNTASSSNERSSTECVDAFFDWIESNKKPFFGFINLMDAHAPYNPPEQFNEFATEADKERPQTPPWLYLSGTEPAENLSKLEDLYDGCIKFLDNQLGKIHRRLRNQGILDDTLFVIASDHGEAFGELAKCGPERLLYGHTQGVDEVLLDVPLVIRFPNRQYEGEKVTHLVSLKHLYHTVLEKVGVDSYDDQTKLLYPDTPEPDWIAAEWDGFTDHARQSAAEHGVNLDRYDIGMSAYYENSSTGPFKYATTAGNWENGWTLTDGAIESIADAQVAEIRSRASRRLNSLSPVVGEEREVKLTDETVKDLKDLGYL